MVKGKCPHGEFDLMEGCPQCIADRMAGDKEEPNLIKVQYYSSTSGELSSREYTYFSEDRVTIGDILTVPVRDTTGKAKVSAIDVPDSEISAFRDKVKIIPTGSILGHAEDGEENEVTVAEAEINYGPGGKGANTYLDRSTDELKSIEISPLYNAGIPGKEEYKLADKVKTIKKMEMPVFMPAPLDEVDAERMESMLKRQLTMEDSELANWVKEPLDRSFNPTDLALRPGEDIEVRSYYEEAQRLLEYAEKRVIKSLEDNKGANDDLAIIAKLKKTMESKKREYLDPLRNQAEAIRETYSTLMDPIIAADKITREKMLAYSAEQNRIRLAQEEINRKRIEAAQEEMRLNGELSESVNLVDVQPEAPKRTSMEMGSTGQKDVWKWEVIDFTGRVNGSRGDKGI